MVARFAGVVVDAREPRRLAEFWSEVVGHPVGGDEQFAWVETPEGAVGIGFQRVPDPTPGKNRIHLDLRPSGRTQAEELERLRALGAVETDVGQPADASWVVLSDPEGNIFCLLGDPVQD